MYYADAHTEFIHHPDDQAPGMGEAFALTQINPELINLVQPELLFLAIWVEDTAGSWERALWVLDEYRKVIAENNWILVQSAADLVRPGIKIILHLEDAFCVGDDLTRFNELYTHGVRSVGLTHNHANQFAGGSHTPEIGMTPLGWEATTLLLSLGMLVDYAHLSRTALAEALAAKLCAPFISHTGLASLRDIPRNIPDSALQELRTQDGFVGIALAGSFLCDLNKRQPTQEDYLNQISHALNVAGATRVGVGSDFGGVISALPEGLENVAKMTILDLSSEVCGQNLLNFLNRSSLA